MRRRSTFFMLAGVATALLRPRSSRAAELRRIAYLHPAIPNTSAQGFADLFREALLRQGWVEGRTLAIEMHWAHGDINRLQMLAREVVRQQVDAIFAVGHAVHSARAATRDISIVAVNLEADPVADGLAASLSRPGGNVTGVFLNAPEMSLKHLQILKEIAPSIERVAVLSQPRISDYQLKVVQAAAGGLGAVITHLPFNGPQDIEPCFSAMSAANAQGLMVLPSPLVNGESRAIAGLAERARVPSISIFRAFAESGGLIHYGPRLNAMFERTAAIVDRILRGALPGELPVEQPTHFENIINLRTARTLGLVVPPALLVRADELIE